VSAGAVAVHPVTAGLAYGVAAALAARQVVGTWRARSWQADLATGLAVLPVVGALLGLPIAVGAFVCAVVVALVAAAAPDAALFPGSGGRLAAAGVVATAVVPSLAAVAMVLVRGESIVAALILVLLVGAYEAGDFLVGSGGTTVAEGPVAGATTLMLLGFPLALVLLSPFDQVGMAALAVTAAACPLGPVMASALLPDAGAHAPALRRIDTLLVVGLAWVAAVGAL